MKKENFLKERSKELGLSRWSVQVEPEEIKLVDENRERGN